MIANARIAALAALALAAGACEHTPEEPPEPIIKTVYVDVPVDDPACAREAVEGLGEGPAYPDTDQALREAANLFERVKLLLAGRALRTARVAAVEGALTECSRGPLSPR